MNDPHVNSLTYDLATAPTLVFQNPPAIEAQFSSFRLPLSNGILIVTILQHFATVPEARQQVEPILEAWSLDVCLTTGRNEFVFEYRTADMVDRNPTPGHVLHAAVGEFVVIGETITTTVTRPNYPPVPTELLITEKVRTMWNRYLRFIDGKEPILSMAYFCLTLLEQSTERRFNQRKHAARRYAVSIELLDAFGKLVSERGDATQARKYSRDLPRTSLTASEEAWLSRAVRLIIRRKAEYDKAPGRQFSQIGLEQLPPIAW
jgi:hypothetical protein